jgi:hypothetical protein
MRKLFVAVALVLAGLATASFATAVTPAGFKTARPAQLVPLENGVVIDPILSVGDTIGDYQMTGIPDGLGAYRTGEGRLRLFMNHELEGPAVPPGVASRISRLTINRNTHRVLAGAYAFTGLEGFTRFCSSTLAVLGGTHWYFTGEEDTQVGALTADPNDGQGRDGSSIALNADTGQWTETKHFGHVLHENVVPVKRLSKAFFLTTDDDFRGDPDHSAYLYAYIAPTWKGAIAGTEGSLYVWKARTGESTSDIAKGERLAGRFVPISQADNATGETLEVASREAGGFKFTRLEDAAVARGRGGRVYFADTGRLGAETVKGRLYRLDIDPTKPRRASVKLLLDGDAGDDIVNPDNIDTSAGAVVIQEDRNAEHRGPEVSGGYGRVLVYELATGALRPVARVDTPATLLPGEWESSGVINASELLGRGWWLVDVQAHKTTASQPGPTLVPDSATGEDGQLLAIYIPNS